ncbi:MAG: type I restriction endonuclease [Pseudomonadota bacterium]|nr:type I restriction endonuclease [Pseudomonadota bacterium]
MDLIDQLNAISSKIHKQIALIQTEEATKNAFIMPFIAALGYNVFDPTEVTPEFSADIGIKKGEKVDYAILQEGEPIILVECKWCGCDLDNEHASQLYRYFSVTKARFGVLTNGITYRFYTDTEERNKMDAKPFLEINMLDIKEQTIDELKKFSKAVFNLQDILTTATELKYTKEIKRILVEQSLNPDDDFVRFFASKVYSGKLTQVVKQQFVDLTKRAFWQFINDKISERLRSVMIEEPSIATPATEKSKDEPDNEEEEHTESRIVTTQEEIEGYYIVKSILRSQIDAQRVVMRDTISYCGILLDDNNRKPICRFYFNNLNKLAIAFVDVETKKYEKFAIAKLDDIFQYADKIITTVQFYDQKAST